MAIERRKITHYSGIGHITFPRAKADQEVIVVYNDDLDNFKNMITNAALLDEVNRQRLSDMQRQLNDFSARLAFLERVLTSIVDKKNNDSHKEPVCDAQPSQPSEIHNEDFVAPIG